MLTERPQLLNQVEAELNSRGAAGISEYELIKALQDAGCFRGWVSDNPTLALFQKHFAVMHILYRLQPAYLEQGLQLAISPLRIQVLPVADDSSSSVSTETDALPEFYLNWDHFDRATPDTVVDLLTSFWRRYAAVDKRQEALQALELDETASWEQIQVQYRRLAAECHPDRGGDSTAFLRVRQAYEVLKGAKG